MTRIDPAPARGPLRRFTYRETRRRYHRDLEPIQVMGHHRPVLAGMGAFELMLERSHRVDDKLKALAELKAAVMVGCEFCIDIGSHLSAREGVTDEQLLALPHHREADCFDEVELLVIDYAAAMTATPAQVTDELFERLRERFDEAQLVELTAAIAWENWRARFNWAFDIGAAGFREGAACPVPDSDGRVASVESAVAEAPAVAAGHA
jgi:AhpD family alkylhydroperoxidase